MELKFTGAGNPEGVTALLYGDSGAGKTHLASLFPTPLFIDCEGGLRSIKRKVAYIDAQTYGDMSAILQDLKRYKNGVTQISGKDVPMETVVIDTIDEMSKRYMGEALRRSGKEVPKFDEWNLMIERTRSTCRQFKDLKNLGLNVVFCSHEGFDKSDITSIVKAGPNLNGSLPEEVCAYMDLVLHLTVKNDTQGKEKRAMSSARDGVFVGKDRTWALSKWEDVPSTPEQFKLFWDKLKGVTSDASGC